MRAALESIIIARLQASKASGSLTLSMFAYEAKLKAKTTCIKMQDLLLV